MKLLDKMLVKIVKNKMKRSFKVGTAPEIPNDGLIEIRNVEYKNRTNCILSLDIFKPEANDTTNKFPTIIYLHGGGLISGNKKNSVGFCRLLAKQGYLVFSLEYRLVPEVKVFEQFDDVCAGMDYVERNLSDFNGDSNRVYLAGESAGALLGLYVSAMQASKPLQKSIGYEPSKLKIKALGLISGMFYTTRKDALGKFMSPMFYGKDKKGKDYLKYANPENDEIIYNIPPAYLTTSSADMYKSYTLDFVAQLKNKGIEHKFTHMGDDQKLLHAYPVLRPDYSESKKVIEEIADWFKKHE